MQVARLALGPPQDQGKPDKRDGYRGDKEEAFEWHDCLSLVRGKPSPRWGPASLIQVKLS
jgi:hypothetical protein